MVTKNWPFVKMLTRYSLITFDASFIITHPAIMFNSRLLIFRAC
jgi:hypothetical protein